MTRRLLRTITVITTVTESWTLVWNNPAPGEPPTVRCYTHSVSSRSTSAVTVAHFTHEPPIKPPIAQAAVTPVEGHGSSYGSGCSPL